MTSLFCHPTHAEDQRNAHAILYLHVMRASTMSFAFLSLFRLPVSILRGTRPIDMSVLLAQTLRSSGRAAVIGIAVGAIATWGRMRGREEIEWQDRSWRVLENEGEVKTDWITIAGSGAGAAAAALAARRGAIMMGMGEALLGGVGAGSSVGTPYMIATFAAGRKSA